MLDNGRDYTLEGKGWRSGCLCVAGTHALSSEHGQPGRRVAQQRRERRFRLSAFGARLPGKGDQKGESVLDYAHYFAVNAPLSRDD